MTDGLHGWPRTRADGHEVIYSEVGGSQYRLRFEPGEASRWALIKSRWDAVAGQWRTVSTQPVSDVFVDSGDRR